MRRINKKIIEGNLLIAKFMGESVCYNYQKSELPMHQFKLEGIKPTAYHERWDWLMPVFEKIEQVSELSPSINFGCGTIIYTDGAGTTRIEIFPETKKESNILISWKAVIEFIKWYNENKR